MGPLARLNIAKSMGTPLADAELAEFKQLAAGPVESSFYYHHARLIDILYGIEKIELILTDPLILDKHVRATAGVNRLEGAGQAEAPRGTLHHHYKVDENGLIKWANLVIATGNNNHAMNKGVRRPRSTTSRTANSPREFSTAWKPWSAPSTLA